MKKLVVVGAGHSAGHFVAEMLRRNFPGVISMVGVERYGPYQRPPLSKAFLQSDEFDATRLELRGAQFYRDAGVDVRLGVAAESLDRTARLLHLRDGSVVPYDHLVLATGARARELQLPGRRLARIGTLRGLDDAKRLRRELANARSVVVVGGGFIGLEVASTARKLGIQVTVLEAGSRLLARSVSSFVADALHRAHMEAGVDVRLQAQVAAFEGDEAVSAVVCSDGERIAADLVVIGVGSEPEVSLAQRAGLNVDRNGIIVDAFTRTSDDAILAIGDCAALQQPGTGRLLRLESVQCALDQAAQAAAYLSGDHVPHKTVPWFWSEQQELKLQIAGLFEADDQAIVRSNNVGRAFCEIYVRDGRLVAAAAINRPSDVLLIRRALGGDPIRPDLAKLADSSIPLSEVLLDTHR